MAEDMLAARVALLEQRVALLEAVLPRRETAQPSIENTLELERSITWLSPRVAGLLARAKISTLRELLQASEANLLSIHSFGRLALAEVKEGLAERGHHLA